MKINTHNAIAFLLVALCGIIGLVLWLGLRRPGPEKANTAHFLSLTQGLVGTMATTYQSFSTNTAATVRKWFQEGTNAALVRVTNNQSCAIWLFPFPRIQTNEQSLAGYESLLLDAPNFSGIRLAAGQAAEIQVMILGHSGLWRVELGYTIEPNDSFLGRLLRLPRDSRAFATRQGVVQNTTIYTEWIQP